MHKIPSVFRRNYETDRLVRNEVVPGCEWVLAGEGRATRKFDGACCMVEDGLFYRRHELKRGKLAPEGFIPAQAPDAITGDQPGWLKVCTGPEDKWFAVAFVNSSMDAKLPDGTYEACGPHFQGNPEGFFVDSLILHGSDPVSDCPRYFDGIRDYLVGRMAENSALCPIEGIVFHHPDGRMAKIKTKDFVSTKRQKAGR